MAKCNPSCSTFKGETGAVWVKIDQMGYDKSKNPPWGSDMLARQNATWTVSIPSSIAPGEYLLRHEILGLHVAGKRMGAQFYPTCVQVKVSGSGSANPKGVALPGAYSPDDKQGVLVELWKVNQGKLQYVAPGGPVWSGK
jgi:lytic cellulose monooxygenase (C1-hydroxylating)